MSLKVKVEGATIQQKRKFKPILVMGERIFREILQNFTIADGLIQMRQISKKAFKMVKELKDKVQLKRELVIDSINPNFKLLKLMKKAREESIIWLYNVITVKVSPESDQEFLRKIRDFYADPQIKDKISKTRFCLDLFDIYDHLPEHMELFKDCLKGFPRATSVRCKHCQITQKRTNYTFFLPAKNLYFTDSQFKLWNTPLKCEQLILSHSTLWSRKNIRAGYLPNCKHFQFDFSSLNHLDFILKPFSGDLLTHYILRYSQVSRRRMLDTLYSITWYQTRTRFHSLRYLDVEGRITEGNVVFLIANLDYYYQLETIKIENGQCQFDMEFVVGHERVREKRVMDNRRVEVARELKEFLRSQKHRPAIMREARQEMVRQRSSGVLKGETIERKFDIRYIPKDKIPEVK